MDSQHNSPKRREFWNVYQTVARALDSRSFESIDGKWSAKGFEQQWSDDQFARFLKNEGCALQADVAALDWAIHELQEARRSAAVEINGGLFADMTPTMIDKVHIDLGDHLRLIATDWDVGGYFYRAHPSGLGAQRSTQNYRRRSYFLTYVALDSKVQIKQIDEFEFKLLGLLQKRCTLSKACEILAESGTADGLGEARARAIQSLADWHQIGILKDLDVRTSV